MKKSIIGIGEFLWDVLPAGPRMGGAAANFACHARALGADAQVVSRVGKDPSGTSLLKKLEETGMPVSGISIDPVHPTGSVSVELLNDGQPVFTIEENVAWDHITADARAVELFKHADAVCFGSLAQRNPASAEAIRSLVRITRPESLRIFDVNLRQSYYSSGTIASSLELANVLKLNDAELPLISEMFGITGNDRERISSLVTRFDLRMVAYTRGANGSILHDGRQWCENPGFAADVRDTVGAGDSFTAAVTLGLLTGWPIEDISTIANTVAAYVCSQDGAIPALPAALHQVFSRANALRDFRSEDLGFALARLEA